MPVEAFRVQNFMGFEDSGWIELRPITLLLGRNSSGKSALLRALLLLQQSLDSPAEVEPLCFVKDNGFDYGDYQEIIRDHDPSRVMSFWFRCRLPEMPFDASRGVLKVLDTVQDVVTIRLTYHMPAKSGVLLWEVELLDKLGDHVLLATTSRKRTAHGSRWRFKSDFANLKAGSGSDLWQFLEVLTKEGFFPWLEFREGYFVEERSSQSVHAQFYSMLIRLFESLRAMIAGFLSSLEYVGPARAKPQRFYHISGRAGPLAAREQNAVREMASAEAVSLDEINNWLRESDLKATIILNPLDKKKTLYELRVLDTRPSPVSFHASLCEVGFGLSQVLPVVAQAVIAPRDSLVLVEQPELHLHPSAQAELGDLFGQAMNQKRFLLETHSENLLLRLRRRLAQSTSGVMEANAPLIRHEDLRVYFVDRMDGVSQVDLLEFDEWGDYVIRPQRFGDFFGQDFEELIKMKNARRAAKSDQ